MFPPSLHTPSAFRIHSLSLISNRFFLHWDNRVIALWTWMFNSLPRFGKLSAIISLNNFLLPFLSPSETPGTPAFVLLMESCCSLWLPSLFILFSLSSPNCVVSECPSSHHLFCPPHTLLSCRWSIAFFILLIKFFSLRISAAFFFLISLSLVKISFCSCGFFFFKVSLNWPSFLVAHWSSSEQLLWNIYQLDHTFHAFELSFGGVLTLLVMARFLILSRSL